MILHLILSILNTNSVHNLDNSELILKEKPKSKENQFNIKKLKNHSCNQAKKKLKMFQKQINKLIPSKKTSIKFTNFKKSKKNKSLNQSKTNQNKKNLMKCLQAHCKHHLKMKTDSTKSSH